MFEFAFGKYSILFVLLFLALYVTGYYVRTFIAWIQGEEPPKERFKPMMVVFGVLGLFLGLLLQPKADVMEACHDAGAPVFKCFLKHEIDKGAVN